MRPAWYRTRPCCRPTGAHGRTAAAPRARPVATVCGWQKPAAGSARRRAAAPAVAADRPDRMPHDQSARKTHGRYRDRLRAGNATGGGNRLAQRCCGSAVACPRTHRPRTSPATGPVHAPMTSRAPPHRPSRSGCRGDRSPPRGRGATRRRGTCRATRAGAATSGWPVERWGSRGRAAQPHRPAATAWCRRRSAPRCRPVSGPRARRPAPRLQRGRRGV